MKFLFIFLRLSLNDVGLAVNINFNTTAASLLILVDDVQVLAVVLADRVVNRVQCTINYRTLA